MGESTCQNQKSPEILASSLTFFFAIWRQDFRRLLIPASTSISLRLLTTGVGVFYALPLVGWCVDRAVSSRVSVVVTFEYTEQ